MTLDQLMACVELRRFPTVGVVELLFMCESLVHFTSPYFFLSYDNRLSIPSQVLYRGYNTIAE